MKRFFKVLIIKTNLTCYVLFKLTRQESSQTYIIKTWFWMRVNNCKWTQHILFPKWNPEKSCSTLLGIFFQNLQEDRLNYFCIILQCIIIKYLWLFYYLSSFSQFWPMQLLFVIAVIIYLSHSLSDYLLKSWSKPRRINFKAFLQQLWFRAS